MRACEKETEKSQPTKFQREKRKKKIWRSFFWCNVVVFLHFAYLTWGLSFRKSFFLLFFGVAMHPMRKMTGLLWNFIETYLLDVLCMKISIHLRIEMGKMRERQKPDGKEGIWSEKEWKIWIHNFNEISYADMKFDNDSYSPNIIFPHCP